MKPVGAGFLACLTHFTAMCGAHVPAPLAARLDELVGNEDAVAEFGIGYATRQCEDPLRQGAPGIHFYTLNKSRSTVRILIDLGSASAPRI